MNRFEFKLEPLYEYRQRLVELCQREFAVARERLDEEYEKLEVLKATYHASSKEVDRLKECGSQTPELNMYAAYLVRLKNHIGEQERIINEVRRELDKKRGQLLEASKNKKAVEIIKERSLETFKEQEKKYEQKVLDEIVSSRFKRV